MNNRGFILLALASLFTSLFSLSRDLNELQGFLQITFFSLLLILAILLATRKYWRDARRVG